MHLQAPASAVARSEETALPAREGAEGGIDMGHEFLHQHGLHRHHAILRIAPHAGGESVREDDEHGWNLPLAHGAIEEGGERSDARKAAARAVQPVEDGKPPVLFLVVGVRSEDMETHRRLRGFALEGVARHSRCRRLRRDPGPLAGLSANDQRRRENQEGGKKGAGLHGSSGRRRPDSIIPLPGIQDKGAVASRLSDALAGRCAAELAAARRERSSS